MASGFDLPGLSTAEALQRHRDGRGNRVEAQTARSFSSIVRANVVTRFNAIIASLAVVVLVFGDPIDAVFAAVMVFNSAIGIVQEVRAKRSLDSLQVLLVPTVGVRRDGQTVELEPDDLVQGDVVIIEPGDQVPVDGVVLASQGLEADESALTGESEPVPKQLGDDVLSGSAVVAGTAWIEATQVGADAWAQKLTSEAKDFVLTTSELRVGIDNLLRFVAWVLPPLAALLVWSQLRTTASVGEGLVAAVAGVVGLVPQGLVLLVSMAMAVAVIRLARIEVVVQELPAVEGLARIDVLCVDKTGTLTTGDLAVDEVRLVGSIPDDEVRSGLAALAELDTARSSTMDAMRPLVDGLDPGWTVEHSVPFNSVRKWSGAAFTGQRAWLLGAPEILLAGRSEHVAVLETVTELTSAGRRVLLIARSGGLAGEELPHDLEPAALVALKEELRPDAADTIDYFGRQGVAVRVISGDHPRTVAAVAAELGVPGAERHVDLSAVDDVAAVDPAAAVFGRVRPEQKRDLVRLLQAQGHIVAMTGDGVNDIPSLKAADIGIAMNSATPATKAIAQLVLLDGRFATMPQVVAEGRRVIANMERVSSLFVTKTVYAMILAVVVGVVGVAFPFLPRHLSLIAAVTIGVPAFLLSFRSNDPPCRPGYLRRVLRFSIPAGIVAATATLTVYALVRSPLGDATLEQARTAATITMTLMGLWILYQLVAPVRGWERWMLAALVAGFAIALVPSPLSDFYALELPPPRTTAVMLAGLAVFVVILQIGWTFVRDHPPHLPGFLRRRPA